MVLLIRNDVKFVEIMFERPDIYRICNEETIYMCHVKLGSGTGHITICRTCSLSILFFVGILFFFWIKSVNKLAAS